jgi:hypothetical protein
METAQVVFQALPLIKTRQVLLYALETANHLAPHAMEILAISANQDFL